MALIYEAVVVRECRDLFVGTFRRYMERLHFAHMSIGGRLGGSTTHEFRRGDHVVSVSVSGEDQSHFRVVVTSDTVPVEPLVVDALTEGVADFLEPFCRALSEEHYEDAMASVISDLREAFQQVFLDGEPDTSP
jgi:hypothetical protein